MKDAVVVTYGDVTLHQSDCEMLEGPYWINDNLIAYYQQYLTLDVFKDDEEILFMGPSAMFLVLFMPDVEKELSSLKLKERRLIFMPINDHDDINSTGGTHWTLLVYSSSSRTFHHFDSMGTGSHTKNAQLVANKIAAVLDIPTAKIEQTKAPQQKNGYDCGFYVLAISEHIARHGLSSSLSPLTPPVVTQYRARLKDIINKHSKSEKKT